MDLDRTLLDTDKFVRSIWQLAEKQYGIDARSERDRAPAYFTHHQDMYDYRFFDHLQAVAGARYDKAAFIAAAVSSLSERFLYDDVTEEVVSRIDAIVTFGNSDYQTFKLLLCPKLVGINRHVLLEPKGPYIARTFSQASILVDDKPLEAEILPPCEFIRIDRSGVRPEQRVITSLHQLPDILMGK